MKYQELRQIADFLQGRVKISRIFRVDDNALCVDFSGLALIFDMSKNKSAIYEGNLAAKSYNSPFDEFLRRNFTNAAIDEISVLENNRILLIKTRQLRSYKEICARIFFEFTGKNTNVIITDENGIILNALRYIDKSYRVVKVGIKLEPLKPFKMDENFVKISDFKAYFEDKFKEINAAKLAQIKQNKITLLERKISALNTLLQGLENENDLNERAKNVQEKAAILTANLYKIKDYEREFILSDFNGNSVEFILDDTPKIWAKRAFERAKKLKQKAANLHLQRENLSENVSNLHILKDLVARSNSAFECEILVPKREKKEREKAEFSGIAAFFYNEFKIMVGKNERANEQLLKAAKKDDIWLHVRDYPSAHAIALCGKKKPSEDALKFAAKMCVEFSNLKPGRYFVDYTRRNFVSVKQKAFVEYVNFKSFAITKE